MSNGNIEMTPKPTIDITDDEENACIVDDRKKKLKRLLRLTPEGEDVIEMWRQIHIDRIGVPRHFANYREYLRAVEDPDPYDETYIFFCMKK
jgi:hypothetical protein